MLGLIAGEAAGKSSGRRKRKSMRSWLKFSVRTIIVVGITFIAAIRDGYIKLGWISGFVSLTPLIVLFCLYIFAKMSKKRRTADLKDNADYSSALNIDFATIVMGAGIFLVLISTSHRIGLNIDHVASVGAGLVIFGFLSSLIMDQRHEGSHPGN